MIAPITNLVDNACKFSPADTSIDVSVTDATIEVGDRGPGVAPEDREHVFDRFYRATSSRSMPGSGLGLSIVQQVADLHGGAVELLAHAGGGTTARFTLPSGTGTRPSGTGHVPRARDSAPCNRAVLVLRRVLLRSAVPVRRVPDRGW